MRARWWPYAWCAVSMLNVTLASCVVVHVEAPRRAPVYDCQAEDGSGRTVRVEYGGDPVRLSEGLADEPGGLWSCASITPPPEGSDR